MKTNTHADHRSGTALAERRIFVSEKDRLRLETIIRAAVATRSYRQDYLTALQSELERAIVVDPADIPHDRVTMNSTVRVRDEETGDVETYSLVYPHLADISKNHLSVLAPIGTAILGCCVGDVVDWEVPSGRVRLKIEAIDFQPERAGRFDL